MKPLWIPVALLGTVLALSLFSGARVADAAEAWDELLAQSQQEAAAGDWNAARGTLETCHQRWLQDQFWLRIAAHHQGLDSAEELFRRAAALSGDESSREFMAETEALRAQIRTMAETEQLRLGNVFTCLPATC